MAQQQRAAPRAGGALDAGRRASRIVTPVWAAIAARAAAEMTTTASRGAPAAPDPAPRSRRMSSSELCWATRTDSADVMQPEQARQSLSVILATPPPSASGRPATPSSCSTARLRPVTGFFWSLTGLTQAADGEMKSSRPSERRTSDIGRARAWAYRAASGRILKIQASLTAHWHEKGADWRGRIRGWGIRTPNAFVTWHYARDWGALLF